MGQEADDGQIASIMLYLQKIGCHNINLVTLSHVVPQILKALDIAVGKGLNIPLVYNCSGYENIDTLQILRDIIDIYMPDNLNGTYQILKFLKEKISTNTHINIMSQYRPMGDAFKIKELSRPLMSEEFRKAFLIAKSFNLKVIR